MADDFGRVQRNVQLMIAQKAPESDIDGYLHSEGLTPSSFKDKVTGTSSGILANVGAGTNEAVTSILGAPVDATTFGLNKAIDATNWISRQFGGENVADNIQKPFLGSQYIQDLESSYGGSPDQVRSDTDAERYARAAGAGVAGAAIGGPLVGAGLGATGAVSPTMAAALGSVTPRVATYGAVGGLTGQAASDVVPEPYKPLAALVGSGLGGLGAAGAEIAGNALGSKAMNILAPEMLKGQVGPRADAVISKYVDRDLGNSRSLTDLTDALTNAQQAGQPLSVMDASGSNVTRLGRLAASAPGEASQTAQTFVAGSRADLPYQAEQALANRVAPSGGARQADEALAASGRAQARPLYEQAYNEPYTPSQEMMDYLKRPAFQDAMRRGVTIAKNEGVDATQLGITGVDDAGNPILGDVPNMRLLDYTKRGLDDVLDSYPKGPNGKPILGTSGNAINSARSDFVNLLDQEAPPSYQAARGIWKGMRESQDAIQGGRNFMKGTRDQISDNFDKLGLQEQDLFRQGMAAQLSEMVGKGQLGQIQRALSSSPDFSRKLTQFLTPDQAQGVGEDFGRLKTIADRNNIVGGGSQTAARTAEMADASGMEGKMGAAFGLLNSYRSGGVSGAVGNLLTRGYGRAVGLSEPVAAAVGKELFTTDPTLQAALISRLRANKLTAADRSDLQRSMLSAALGGLSVPDRTQP